jgi:3-dehydrosphinganine reductase
MKTLDQKLVLITGGSSGIGLACAKLLAGMGSNLLLIARDEAKLTTAKREIAPLRKDKSQVIASISADVSDRNTIQQACQEIKSVHGIPDVIINSAGVVHPGECVDLDLELFSWMMEINYQGTVNIIKAFLPEMIQRRSGHIVNISSIAGYLAVYGYSAYSASKFAVKGFSDALRLELQPHNIQVSIVFPPDTDTPQLEYDNQYKPPILAASEEGTKPYPPESVAQATINGIINGRYIITPGSTSTLYFKLVGLLGGGLLYKVLDFVFADARSKVRRNPGKYSNHHVT